MVVHFIFSHGAGAEMGCGCIAAALISMQKIVKDSA